MPEDKRFPFLFSLVTDFAFIPEDKIEQVIESALRGGVDLVQFRAPGCAAALRLERARRIKNVTGKKVPLIINSDIELMKQIDADGVQVKSGDLALIPAIRDQVGSSRYIGASVHNKEEILLACKSGADFLVLSPLFTPGSKPGAIFSLGEEKFQRLQTLTDLPVIALGGINLSNAEIPILCGAQGVSMVTGLLRGGDIYRTAKRVRHKLSSALRLSGSHPGFFPARFSCPGFSCPGFSCPGL